jgi:type II secretory pathway predicted ATPase ExeA
MNYLSFKKFLASAGLSTRRFGDLCGIGKTTIHRLAQAHHAGLTPKYVKSITPTLQRACLDHLQKTGAPADAAHLILSDIFGEEFTPSIVTRAVLTPDMLRFFGLAHDPFAAPRNPNEVFFTPAMEQVKTALDDAVKFQGFMAVLAPVGAGKTVIKNLMTSPRSKVRSPRSESPSSPPYEGGVAAVSADGVVLSTNAQPSKNSPPMLGGVAEGRGGLFQDQIILSPKFADPAKITAAGIVAYILEAFHLKPRRSLVLAQRQLEDHLAELDTPVALCFDECHRLSDTTLSALKNFYELGTGGFQRYLGLVLFGQPQFAARIALPRFREIAERLAVFELPPFSAEDTAKFLDHCLTRALPARPSTSGLFPANGAFTLTGEGAPPFPCSKFEVQSSKSVCPDPLLEISGSGPSTLNLEHGTLNPSVFTDDALRAISSRASTPLAVANLAAAALIEAYKKGERQVTARFVPDDRGPRANKV